MSNVNIFLKLLNEKLEMRYEECINNFCTNAKMSFKKLEREGIYSEDWNKSNTFSNIREILSERLEGIFYSFEMSIL